MAKKTAQSTERPTAKAAYAYAAQLREQAGRARAVDPNVELYAPSYDTARQIVSRNYLRHGKEFGPQKAIEEMARIAFEREQEYAEAEQRASEARRVHLIHQSISAGERDARRRHMPLGLRLDVALVGLEVVSEAAIARLDADVVKGSGAGHGDHLARLTDTPRRRRLDGRGVWERDLIAEEALRLVERAEQELEQARRRVVEVEAA